MRADAELGFTLLEMLVALAVLSLAVLALVNLTGENVRTEALLEARTFAAVVAENRAIETLTSPVPPPLGETDGTEAEAARLWRWTRRVSETPELDLVRVDIAVRSQDDEQVLSEVTIFRGRR